MIKQLPEVETLRPHISHYSYSKPFRAAGVEEQYAEDGERRTFSHEFPPFVAKKLGSTGFPRVLHPRQAHLKVLKLLLGRSPVYVGSPFEATKERGSVRLASPGGVVNASKVVEGYWSAYRRSRSKSTIALSPSSVAICRKFRQLDLCSCAGIPVEGSRYIALA